MSPTGEQVTLMVIPSFPGTERPVAETKSKAQAGRQPRGGGKEGIMEPGLLLDPVLGPPLVRPELHRGSSFKPFLPSPRGTASWH